MLSQCVYCLKHTETTRDHVISNALFPDIVVKHNVITAPCCYDCNHGFSKDEEYLRNFLSNGAIERSFLAKTLFTTKVTRALQRRPPLAYHYKKNMEPVEVFTKSGIYLGKRVKWHISKDDWKRYHRVLDKYIKGLIFHVRQEPLPSDYQIRHSLATDEPKLIEFGKNVAVWNRDNEDVFAFGYNFIPEKFTSIWVLVFYETIFFQTFVVQQKDLTGFNRWT